MKAIGLKAEQMIDPIGLQTAAPMLSWVLDEGQQQCAYRITACVGGKMVWDSGKVESSLMMVPCGYTAEARERVLWSVEIWATVWAAVIVFIAGKLYRKMKP